MSTTTPSLRDEIQRCNHELDCILRRRLGVSVKTYRIVKSVTQLIGVLAASYALYLGTVDPFFPLVIIAGIILGPDYVEAVVVGDRRGDSSEEL